MTINVDGIPDELKKLDQWVGWQIEKDEKGNPTKVPYFSKTQRKASTTNPEDWSGFLFTLEAVKDKFHTGIGFVFCEEDSYCFIDLDKCVDKKTDVIESWALNIIEKLQSYTERSQSYTDPEKEKYGIHIIVKAKLPEWSRNRKGNFEIYDSGRYACMTGNVLQGSPMTIEERQEQINQICSEIFGKPEPKPTAPGPGASTSALSDQEIIEKASKAYYENDVFNRLYSQGDISLYDNDDSIADYHLARLLAFWTLKDMDQIERIMRTSTLQRDKWNTHKTYLRELTIQKAINNTTKVYNPGGYHKELHKFNKEGDPVAEENSLQTEPSGIVNQEPETKSNDPKVSEYNKHKDNVNSILSRYDLNTDEGKKSALRESESYIKIITNTNIAGSLWNIVNKELNLTDVERDIELTFKSAAELEKMDLPEIRWIVPGIIPEGLTILAGKPKMGKSLLALGLAVAISSGGKAFSSIDLFEYQGSVLYLALEDNNRRMKKRLSKLCMGEKFPKNLIYTTEIKRGTEGVKSIRAWLKKNSEDARLVVIDTFVSFRGKASSKMTSEYERDSSDMELIQRLAGEFGIGIIIIHHLRKAIAEDDFDTISGTLGLTGKADTNLILKRTRGEADAVLMGTGRDLDEDIDIALKFDTSIASWISLGNAGEYLISREKKAIIDIISKSKDEPLSPKEIAETLGKRAYIIQTYLGRLMDDGLIVKTERGRYKIK